MLLKKRKILIQIKLLNGPVLIVAKTLIQKKARHIMKIFIVNVIQIQNLKQNQVKVNAIDVVDLDIMLPNVMLENMLEDIIFNWN